MGILSPPQGGGGRWEQIPSESEGTRIFSFHAASPREGEGGAVGEKCLVHGVPHDPHRPRTVQYVAVMASRAVEARFWCSALKHQFPSNLI